MSDALPPRTATYTHDPEAGAWYFNLTKDWGPVAKTLEGADPVVNVDLDEHGNIIGIEVVVTLPEPSPVPPKEER
ncbi:DUF2283 domain-containing protein [Planomonospora sp. ID67723]|uniref:DUF2283 domain-containing protein n=1 Tax=Planomonospora sp. ID67723 TaxID=2738134 RepID=UPI0018C405B1|nr:DUF2283 domain-containing protein [Planomonospora sp. ID67723]MBG0828532.1 DUF2283 domain-containing protein [Planomonospora sp. ID67723]